MDRKEGDGATSAPKFCRIKSPPSQNGIRLECCLEVGHQGDIHRFVRPDRFPSEPDKDIPSPYDIEGNRYEG